MNLLQGSAQRNFINILVSGVLLYNLRNTHMLKNFRNVWSAKGINLSGNTTEQWKAQNLRPAGKAPTQRWTCQEADLNANTTKWQDSGENLYFSTREVREVLRRQQHDQGTSYQKFHRLFEGDQLIEIFRLGCGQTLLKGLPDSGSLQCEHDFTRGNIHGLRGFVLI